MFKVGDEVVCLLYGEGKVVNICVNTFYPIVVEFKDDNKVYTKDGKITSDSVNQCLYHKGTKINIEPYEPIKYVVGKFYVIDTSSSGNIGENRLVYAKCVSEDGTYFCVNPGKSIKIDKNWKILEV